MEAHVLYKVLELYKKNDWQGILKLNENSDNAKASRLLWVWPSESNLIFLKECLNYYNIESVISLGCGCGLLEWIIKTSIGIPVLGYEVNKEWWESKYSNPNFIDLNYADDGTPVLDSLCALLFCYFNNGAAFRDYIHKYSGHMVIIIGPDDGSGRHTDPQPFTADFGVPNWRLAHFQEVKNTKDFIAVYLRHDIS